VVCRRRYYSGGFAGGISGDYVICFRVGQYQGKVAPLFYGLILKRVCGSTLRLSRNIRHTKGRIKMDCTLDCELAKKAIIENGAKIDFSGSDHYIRSYPILLEAAEHLCETKKEDAPLILAHIAYGWMPTIFKEFDFSTPKGFIGEVRKVSDLEKARGFIKNLDDSPINDSWVGLSKVLHFIEPELFPIWDGNVAECFFKPTQYQMKKKENYICYIKCIEYLLDKDKNPEVSEIVSETQTKLEKMAENELSNDQREFEKDFFKVSRVRACEFILFSIGKEEKKEKAARKKADKNKKD
jgi:hypothetical protein